MDGWQRKAFDKAYKEKVETGTSPLKKQKLQDQKPGSSKPRLRQTILNKSLNAWSKQ